MNFDYLQEHEELKELHSFCHQAERFVMEFPDASVRSSRNALEWVVKLFYLTKYGKVKDTTLFELVTDTDFTSYIDDPLQRCIHLIRQLGNNASHAEQITKIEAIKVLEALVNVVGEIVKFLGIVDDYPPFDFGKIKEQKPTPVTESDKPKVVKIVLNGEKFKHIKVKVKNNVQMTSTMDFTEAQTRKVFIDAALREAGWSICEKEGLVKPSTACIEIPVKGMPNNTGDGFVDYVLYGDDNRPLAVVEAKRTSKDVNTGSVQAKLYADCLEKQYGRRPVVFYTNGYQIFMVDGGYPARRVFGYYTKEELHSLILKRSLGNINDTRVDRNISDRPFIQEAVTKVCETYSQKRRMALNVMATGTGKTRFAISLVDVLQRNNWVENVLFLADRTELVSQAKKAFVKYLPNSSICSISETSSDDRDFNARIILSTYPTMLNLLEKEERKFGVGRFDLIIIDEAHRSVYNKYQSILRYFDCLVLGLTATPREQVEQSTYELFNLPKGEPTFSYDYETAVTEGFLVDYCPLDRTTNLLKNGLKYKNLDDNEKKQYEEKFGVSGEPLPEIISHDEFYKNVMNLPTIDIVLNTLMTEGLRTRGGEELGKTIIFGVDHDHAVAIVDRFRQLYPDKGNEYCQLVDYSVNYVGAVIDDFKVPTKEPVIAVSVDMMDTGIDVPEVLNLVFFKRVFSMIKFWQMIGRGTRTCKGMGVFSPPRLFFGNDSDIKVDTRSDYDDKQGFFIFDFCDNFSYFDINPQGKVGKPSLSVSQRVFNLKLEMVVELQRQEHQDKEIDKRYYLKWKEELLNTIKNLNRNLIDVKYQLKYVDKYSDPKSWDFLTILDMKEIQSQITNLIQSQKDDLSAKALDAFVFNMELDEIVGEKDYSKAIVRINTICNELLNKTTIPDIAQRKDKLKLFTSDDFWKNRTLDTLEDVRIQLRDLMKFLREERRPIIVTNFSDYEIDKGDGTHVLPSFKDYRQKVMDYLIENIDLSSSIHKIRNIEPITDDDLHFLELVLCSELGTKDDFDRISNGLPLPVFVRKIVGLETDAINRVFSDYLSKYEFNSDQQEFLHEIVIFVQQNGDIEPKNLINDSPFKDQEYMDLFDDNVDAVFELVDVLHKAVCL